MHNYETLTYEIKNNVGIITLNRPEVRNSLNQKLRFELLQAIEKANNDTGIKVVVIAGAGKGFCSGADLHETLPGHDVDGFITKQLQSEYNPIIKGIIHAEKPYISLVNGAAAGIGAAIALSCDLVVMAENSFIYSAFAAISLIPDGGSHKILQSFLGSKKAFEMIAFSQKLSAKECLNLGMANKVVADDQLLTEGIQWAEELSTKAPITLKLSKQLLREALTADIEQVLDREAQLQNLAFRSDDFQEGVSAFINKRTPDFTGK